jgi:RNA polymerase sigma factor (sigma-70 family)
VAKRAATPIRHLIQRLVEDPRVQKMTDQELLSRFRRDSDEAAFNGLVRRHGSMVLEVCRNVLGNEADAEDAFQATFLVLAQKATTIQKEMSLGCWLYGVAYRTALSARKNSVTRAKHETRSLARRPTELSDDITWGEVKQVLYEELNRTLECYRSALVLCYLEGNTQDEAATLLGVSKDTVKKWLERGRALLRIRLVRRGLGPVGVLLAASWPLATASAKLEPLLVSSTVKAATLIPAGELLAGGPVSVKVLTLVEGVNRAMSLNRCKTGLVLLLCLAIVGPGLGLAILRGASATQPPPAQRATDGRPIGGPAVLKESVPDPDGKQQVVIKGRALGPDGKPFKGAKVYLNAQGQEKPPVRATTGDDGRFEFRVRRSELAGPEEDPPQVVATGDGCGADWRRVPTEGTAELTLRLIKDDVPIRGRILTLEGKPVAGAKVRVHGVLAYPGGDLTPLLKAMREGKDRGEYPTPRGWPFRLPNQPKEVVCDAAGRFRLSGVGREREVVLAVEGPGIQHGTITVYTRVMEPISPPHLPPSFKHYGATFDHQVLPGRTLTGVVREKGTRKPLANVAVGGQGTLSQVRSDARGRYELSGFAKAETYTVMAAPEAGGTHLPMTVVVPDAAGLGPLTADLELVPGISFRGKVTDKETGKPVTGLVRYYALFGNANVPPRGPELNIAQAINSSSIAADGSFSCAVLPGPGVVVVTVTNGERYQAASVGPPDFFKVFKVGTEKKSPFGTREYLVTAQGLAVGQHNLQGIFLIDPAEGDKPIERALVLERAARLTVRMVGPDDKPLAGARVFGSRQGPPDSETLEGAEFTMARPSSGRPHTLYAEHPAQKVVGVLVVKGTEKGPIPFRLEHWAVVSGQLVTQGGPLAEITLNVRGPNNSLGRSIRTDKEGKFRMEGLVPGVKYSAWVYDGVGFVEVWKDLTLKPGETKDLRKVSVGRSPKE